ncbi:MAG: thioesterase family protein [Acidimicrobiia bacterium]
MPTTQKIRYSDCDPQGIVFNGNYGRYWDDAVTDWMDEAGFGGFDLGGTGAEMVAARMEIDFKAPATMGDVLETTVVVERLGSTSMTIGITTRRQSDGEVIVAGREVIVFIDPSSRQPIPIPDPIRVAFS